MLLETLRLNAHKKLRQTLVLASIPIVLALTLLVYQFAPTSEPAWPLAYMIDEETGEVSVARADRLPPVAGRDGRPTVVRAVYLTAGTAEHRVLAYYEKFTDEAKAALERSSKSSNDPDRLSAYKSGLLVRLPSPGSPWMLASSPEGVKLLEDVFQPDPSKPPMRLCPPPAE